MTDHFQIPLRFIDPPDEEPALALDEPAIGYLVEPTGKREGKLAGRFLLRPDLDLARYSVNAKIDWIRVGFTTGRRTNWKNVHDTVKRVTGRGPDVTGPGGEKRHNGDRFLVQIQDPEPLPLLGALSALRAKTDIAGVGLGQFGIDGIEVSVDWRPKSGLDRERWLMVEALRRHHLVQDVIYTGKGDQPRSFIGPRTAYALKRPTKGMLEPELEGDVILAPNPQRRRDLRPQSHVQLPVDRTYYVGAKTSPVRFRIMDKTTDQKNPAKQTRVELEKHERSARIEATLEKQPAELGGPAAIGLITVEDLIDFRFQELRKLLFDFWLPTVSARKGRGAGKPDAKELQAFRSTGVFGLERYQRATYDRHEEMRAMGLVRGRLPEMGEKGYRVAYGSSESGGGMNKRVEQALTHLSNRWSRETLRRALPPVRDLGEPLVS